jgi:hypothetical protein
MYYKLLFGASERPLLGINSRGRGKDYSRLPSIFFPACATLEWTGGRDTLALACDSRPSIARRL